MTTWRVEFESVGTFASDVDAMTSTVILRLFERDKDHERWSVQVKLPEGAAMAEDFIEVEPPKFLGFERPVPPVPHRPFRDAVVGYLARALMMLESHEPDPMKAFHAPLTVEFEGEPSDAGW